MKFKEITIFFVVCYVACVITKIIMHHFTFAQSYLLDSLFIAVGATTGWGLCTYLSEKKKKKN